MQTAIRGVYLLATFALPATTWAEADVLLRITGDIDAAGAGAVAFDLADLQALDPVTIETTTIWTDGPQVFTGVELGRLMEEVGARGDTARAIAVNDYFAAIPSDDWVEGGALVAYLLNGAPMSLRDKGPLWIVYPYDENPDWSTEVAFARSVWQLDRIEVE